MQGNIGAYGDDAGNVTIFGESAGSWSVECLLSSEKAAGYFHKAIGQSGSLKCPFIENEALRALCLDFGRKYFKVTSDEEFKKILTNLPIEEVVKFYEAVPMPIASGFTGIKPFIRSYLQIVC